MIYISTTLVLLSVLGVCDLHKRTSGPISASQQSFQKLTLPPFPIFQLQCECIKGYIEQNAFHREELIYFEDVTLLIVDEYLIVITSFPRLFSCWRYQTRFIMYVILVSYKKQILNPLENLANKWLSKCFKGFLVEHFAFPFKSTIL